MDNETVAAQLLVTDHAKEHNHTSSPAARGCSVPARVDTRATTILALGTEQGFVQKVLGESPHRLLYAHTTAEVLHALNSSVVDLVILPNHVAGFDGLDCCRKIKASRKTELVPVLMVTGDEVRSQIEALNAGADHLLCLPVHFELARTQIRTLLRQKAATDRLEPTEGILFALAQTVEQRDHTTGGHCERLSLFSLVMGMALGLSDEDLQALYRGGYLHDIGKVGVPDRILCKPGPLDESEWETMRSHTVRGEDICRPLRSLERVLPIIRNHHERWDGSGYPDGLRGQQIPLLARVLQLSDIYDALISRRPYKDAMPPETALEIMQQETDRGWRDPELMGLFTFLHNSTKSKKTWRDAEDMQHSLHNLRQHLMEA